MKCGRGFAIPSTIPNSGAWTGTPSARDIGRRPQHLARTSPASINRMLAELGVSHTGYYTPDETAYYDLADIFSRGLKSELARHFDNGEVVYAGLGVLTRNIEGRHFVSGVLDGYPAAAAGLTVGDELIAVAGVPFEPVRSFAGKAGKPLTLTVRRRAGGAAVGRDRDAAAPPSQPGLSRRHGEERPDHRNGRPPDRLCAHLVLRPPPVPGAARGSAHHRKAQGRRIP